MAGFDPFDDESDEAPAIEEPQETAPKKTTRVRKTASKPKETEVAETAENDLSKLSITLKGGPGFDAPWVVLYPKTLDEAKEILGDVDVLKEILEGTQKAAEFFINAAPEKPAGGSNAGARGGNTGNRSAAPQGATEHPDGKREFCEHGEMKFKSGTAGPKAKNPGAPYKMFVCGSNVQGCRPKNA